MKYVSLVTALAFGFAGHAFAEEEQSTEAQTKMKIEDTKEKNKVPGDIDEEITNAKLRAESGSKSKWSGSFTGSYLGASLAKPFDNTRPNPSQDPNPPRVNMSGDLGIRYRPNKNISVSFGTGVSLEEPFHRAKYGDVSNPYVAVNNVRKIGGVQNIASATVAATTNADERTIGQDAAGSLVDIMMYDFGGSRLSVGLILEGDYNYYRSGSRNETVHYRSDPEDEFKAGSKQKDYMLGAFIPMEYAFSDKIQWRTVFRPWTFDHAALAEGWTFRKRRWSQSMGVVFAVTRDINLYPNFQWDVEQWRGNDYNFFAKNVRDNSTVGLQATINVF